MALKIEYSPKSKDDLRGIFNYIAISLGNKEAARRVVNKIIDEIDRLSDSPEIGPSLVSKVDIQTDLRYLVIEKFIVVYQLKKDRVNVARVFYGGMDYISILFQEELTTEGVIQ